MADLFRQTNRIMNAMYTAYGRGNLSARRYGELLDTVRATNLRYRGNITSYIRANGGPRRGETIGSQRVPRSVYAR